MKTTTVIVSGLWAAACLAAGNPSPAGAQTILYATGFEPAEGYEVSLPLNGQLGWVGSTAPDCPGNGLRADNGNHQAYVGIVPLCGDEQVFSLGRPVNFSPLAEGKPRVIFATRMTILDSQNDFHDCFRWSVFNLSGVRLLTIDFDNTSKGINYLLENSVNFVSTGRRFTNGVAMHLEVSMNFESNRWSATLDGTALVTDQPIARPATALTLRSIDAVWVYNFPFSPGDNALLFDDYRITAGSEPVEPPVVAAPRFEGADFVLRVEGENGRRYAVETTSDFLTWQPLETNVVTGGSFEFRDAGVAGQPRRFY
ncbi:MAG TPA: hypothetical protein VNO52_17610, partial [Methylomirabilota bacterium]|nr:hypothetical protein [Methylomirabilota bacterium]